MTYKVTIEADTTSELAGKVLALAAAFQTTKADKPKAEEPKAEEPKAEEPKAEKAPLDFEKDVTPLILQATKELGRERILSIYERFGIARASELATELLPELLSAIRDELN